MGNVCFSLAPGNHSTTQNALDSDRDFLCGLEANRNKPSELEEKLNLHLPWTFAIMQCSFCIYSCSFRFALSPAGINRKS